MDFRSPNHVVIKKEIFGENKLWLFLNVCSASPQEVAPLVRPTHLFVTKVSHVSVHHHRHHHHHRFGDKLSCRLSVFFLVYHSPLHESPCCWWENAYGHWAYVGSTLGVHWVCGGHTLGIRWLYVRCTLGLHWVHIGHIECMLGIWWVGQEFEARAVETTVKADSAPKGQPGLFLISTSPSSSSVPL